MLSYAVVANTAHLQMLRRPITQTYILRHYETPAMPAPTWRSPPSPAAWPHRCRPTSRCGSWRMGTDAWSPQSTDLTTEVDSQGCTSAARFDQLSRIRLGDCRAAGDTSLVDLTSADQRAQLGGQQADLHRPVADAPLGGNAAELADAGLRPRPSLDRAGLLLHQHLLQPR